MKQFSVLFMFCPVYQTHPNGMMWKRILRLYIVASNIGWGFFMCYEDMIESKSDSRLKLQLTCLLSLVPSSLFTNSNWFAFQNDNINDAPTSASEILDEINLNGGTSHGGNSSSDDEVVVGEDEELVACKNSNNGTSSSSNSNPMSEASDGDLKNNNDSGFFRFETRDKEADDRPIPEWVGWEKPSVGGSGVNPFEDAPPVAGPCMSSSPNSGGENGNLCGNAGGGSLFEEDVEFVGVEVEGTEKAMDEALKEGTVGEAGALKRKVVIPNNKDNKIGGGGGGMKEFNDANYWKVDQEVEVLE